MMELEHKFIAGMLHFFGTEKNFYLVMPYLPKGNLRDYLRRNTRFEESVVKFYIT